MKQLSPALAPLALALALGACTTNFDRSVPRGAAAPVGSAVALGQAVQVGTLTVTPQTVVEDSRCPSNARCVWAGRLVVRSRIDGAGWSESGNLVLGEPFAVRGTGLALTSGEPAPDTERKPAAEAYRFTFEPR